MKDFLRAGALAALLLISFTTSSFGQYPPVRERLGGRIGGVLTTEQLNDTFKNGYNLTLHFTERLQQYWFLDINIGAIYLGDMYGRQRIAEYAETLNLIFNPVVSGVMSEMRILRLSVGPQFIVPVGDTFHAYGTIGGGVYTVSILNDTGVNAYDFSDSHFGFHLGGGMLWRITPTWNIDVNLTAHHFRTGQRDLFAIYTAGGEDPVLAQLSIGVAIDLR